MMPEPEVWSLERLLTENLGVTSVWATPSVRARVAARLPFPVRASLAELEPETQTLIVVGGGTLIDLAKVWRRDHAPSLRLIAIASVWGSGAEGSPVAVTHQAGRKIICVDRSLVPDVRVPWLDLAESLPPLVQRRGCGDAWSHALEAFMSPLATPELRGETSTLLQFLRELPIGSDPRWFEASVAACRVQAKSSVGLVHGIAHTLEGLLATAEPEFGWGHAALCSTFLWPVLCLDAALSPKPQELCRQYGLSWDAFLSSARSLFEEEAYDRALPVLEAHWTAVLRDPCTRTNGVLVRPGHLDHFRLRAFAA